MEKVAESGVRWKYRLIAGAVALQLFVLVAMILLRLTPLTWGTTVTFPVRPVDPRSLFRGDYVTLEYPFTQYPEGKIVGLKEARGGKREGRIVYAVLEPDANGPLWHATELTTYKPQKGLYLKGHMKKYGRLHFGIEAWFVEEGRGHILEEAIQKGEVVAEVAVSPGGKGALRRVYRKKGQKQLP